MQGGAKVVIAIVFGIAMMTAMVVQGEGNIDCKQVGFVTGPCFHYLAGSVSKPPSGCCGGIKFLKTKTTTAADRRAVCKCFKDAGAHFISHIIPERAVELPRSCGVDLGGPIFPKDNDCSYIHF